MTDDCGGASGQPYSVDVLESSTSTSCVDNGGGLSEKSFSTSSDSASSYHTAVTIFITVNYCCTMIVLTLASIDSHLKTIFAFVKSTQVSVSVVHPLMLDSAMCVLCYFITIGA